MQTLSIQNKSSNLHRGRPPLHDLHPNHKHNDNFIIPSMRSSSVPLPSSSSSSSSSLLEQGFSLLGISSSSNQQHHQQQQQQQNDATGKTVRRRRLNWRVGPLQKKRNNNNLQKQNLQHIRQQSIINNNNNNHNNNDEISIAERTVKSVHTCHSTETIKVGNNRKNTHTTNNKNDNSHNDNNKSYITTTPPAPSTPISQTRRRKMLSLTQKNNHNNNNKSNNDNIHSPSSTTVALTPSSFISKSDDEYEASDDDGTVITSLELPLSEESNRTIGLFLHDGIRGNVHQQQHQQSQQDTPTSSHKSKINGMKLYRKGRELPPRSPHIGSPNKSFTYKPKNNDKGSPIGSTSTRTTTKDDDDSESNESGGPLWQLAKLQAISEGHMPSSKSNVDDDDQYEKHNMSIHSKISSSQESSSTDPQEIQMRQAERNLRAIHSLAEQHLQFNEIPEAIDVLQEILRGVRELHGEEHYRVGTVLHNLCTVFMRIRDFKKASYYCRQAVEIRKKALGSLHPDLALSLSQMGVIHLELEEYDEAVKCFQQALVIRRRTLSSNDPEIARLLNNIGCSSYEAGKLELAKESFEAALIVQKASMHGAIPKSSSDQELGRNDQQSQDVNDILLSITSTLRNIGSVALQRKQYNEAVVALEEALLLQQSLLGDDHPIVKNTKDSIEIVINSSRTHNNHMVSLDCCLLQCL